jgi:hypothetical protein
MYGGDQRAFGIAFAAGMRASAACADSNCVLDRRPPRGAERSCSRK